MPRLLSSASTVLLLFPLFALADAPSKGIPQDAAQIAKDRQERAAWKVRTLGEAYEKVGKKDPKWDKDAREALAAFVVPFSDLGTVFVPAKKALDAGCDDPLILYLYARTSYNANFPGAEEVERRFTKAADAIKDSPYPAFRRASALLHAGLAKANAKNSPQQSKEAAARMLDQVVALLPKSLDEEKPNPELEDGWFNVLKDVVTVHRKLGSSKEASVDRVEQLLSKDKRTEQARLRLKGYFLLWDGWDARGTGLAGTVTEEGGRIFQAKLTEARKTLEAAWQAQPGDSRTATVMLTVEKGIGGGDRTEMEKWFQRAMATNGDNREACQYKLDWLDPKWYGDPESLLAFSQACRDTKNVNSGIPVLLAEAHFRISRHMAKEQSVVYLTNPTVWKDINSVYEQYLDVFPRDSVQRSRYAALCTMCRHYPEAKEQFNIVGDRLFGSTDYPLDWLKQLRDFISKLPDNPEKKSK
jgi:hypothetical protein